MCAAAVLVDELEDPTAVLVLLAEGREVELPEEVEGEGFVAGVGLEEDRPALARISGEGESSRCSVGSGAWVSG